MRSKYKFIFIFIMAALLLTGCMKTVDQMYRLPSRSPEFTELQRAIDTAMDEMAYCAPESGGNQQAVQMADLNGDGAGEYLVFAKADTESPLRVLIFMQQSDSFVLAETITCNGTSFDMLEYAHMDGRSGVELVIGSQLSQSLQRNVEVYTFDDSLSAHQLLSVGYSDYLIVDMDTDRVSELFVLRDGGKATDKGIVQLYKMGSDEMVASNEATLSVPASKLRRISAGNVEGYVPAVYASSSVEDGSMLTDIYLFKNGRLRNITLSADSGTSIRTLRNDDLFAVDMDNDGIFELPYILPMMPMDNMVSAGKQELIRWYAMTSDGEEVAKTYTFHNFSDGWYWELDPAWAQRLTVVNGSGAYEFYIWDEAFESSRKVLSIVSSTGDNPQRNMEPGQIVLYESTELLLIAQLQPIARSYGITKESLTDHFHRVR